MITINSLRKTQRSSKKATNRFQSTIPVLRYENENLFMLNDNITKDYNEYVSVVKHNDNIILIIDNYDKLDIKPRKITINKSGSFRSAVLKEYLDTLFIYNDGTMFELEEVQLNDNFIGYLVKDLLTTNQQPSQAI